jgi:hypothetical protein
MRSRTPAGGPWASAGAGDATNMAASTGMATRLHRMLLMISPCERFLMIVPPGKHWILSPDLPIDERRRRSNFAIPQECPE